MIAGGIHEDILDILTGHDAADAVTGGLGLVGNDGDLLANEEIRQSGLAHIGAATNGDHCSFRFHIYLLFIL